MCVRSETFSHENSPINMIGPFSNHPNKTVQPFNASLSYKDYAKHVWMHETPLHLLLDSLEKISSDFYF